MINKPATVIFASILAMLSIAYGENRHWEKTSSPETTRGPIVSLAIHGADISTVTSQGDGVLRSSDFGASWRLVKTDMFALGAASTVSYCGKKIFAVSSTDGIFRYDDPPGTWTSVNAGLPSVKSVTLAANETDVFAGTDSGLFRSTDYGETWKLISSKNRSVFDVSGNTIIREFGFVSNGFLRSIDGGLHWDTLKTLGNFMTADSANVYFREFYLIGTSLFAVVCCSGDNYFSNDTGRTWNEGGIDSLRITVNNGRAIFKTKGYSYFTTDSGKTWKNATSGLPANTAVSSCTRSDTNLLIGTTQGKIYRYDANQSGWKELGKEIKKSGSVASVASTGDGIFTITNTGQLFRSADGGSTWENAAAELPWIKFLAGSGGAIFAGTSRAVFRSVNAGNDWSEVLNEQTIRSLFPMRPSSMDGAYITTFLASGGTLFLIYATDVNGTIMTRTSKHVQSDDNGVTWVPSSFQSNWSYAELGSDVFFASNLGVIRHIADSTSEIINAGLPDSSAISLFTCNGQAYACPKNLGVFKLKSDKTGWVEQNAGLTSKNVTGMIGKGNVVFAGTAGGVFYSTNNGEGWIADNSGFGDNSTVTSLVAGNDYLFALIDSSLWRLPLADFTSGIIQENIGNGHAIFSVFGTGSNLSVDFSLPGSKHVTIALFDLAGRELASIAEGQFDTGKHHVYRTCRNLTPGCYMVRMQAGEHIVTERISFFLPSR